MVKQSTCKCGSLSLLIKRRNFPFGRVSGGRTTIIYRCSVCKEECPAKK